MNTYGQRHEGCQGDCLVPRDSNAGVECNATLNVQFVISVRCLMNVCKSTCWGGGGYN